MILPLQKNINTNTDRGKLTDFPCFSSSVCDAKNKENITKIHIPPASAYS
jgi:hypothetical protein